MDPQSSGRIFGSCKVAVGRRVRLDKIDRATGTHGAGHIEVERRLLSPAGVLGRIVSLLTTLIQLLEAAIACRAGRQPKLRAINAQVRFGVPVTVRVHDRDNRARASCTGHFIGIPQAAWAIAANGDLRVVDQPARTVGYDMSMATGIQPGDTATYCLVINVARSLDRLGIRARAKTKKDDG